MRADLAFPRDIFTSVLTGEQLVEMLEELQEKKARLALWPATLAAKITKDARYKVCMDPGVHGHCVRRLRRNFPNIDCRGVDRYAEIRRAASRGGRLQGQGRTH